MLGIFNFYNVLLNNPGKLSLFQSFEEPEIKT